MAQLRKIDDFSQKLETALPPEATFGKNFTGGKCPILTHGAHLVVLLLDPGALCIYGGASQIWQGIRIDDIRGAQEETELRREDERLVSDTILRHHMANDSLFEMSHYLISRFSTQGRNHSTAH